MYEKKITFKTQIQFRHKTLDAESILISCNNIYKINKETYIYFESKIYIKVLCLRFRTKN